MDSTPCSASRLPLRFHLLALSLLFVTVPCGAADGAARTAAADRRVVLIVIDQCRADYLDRFSMPRVNELRKLGVDCTGAVVGHLPSETIVCHAVIPTGVFPRRLPWADEAFTDLEGVLGPAGRHYQTTWITLAQMEKLLAHGAGQRPESLPETIRRAAGGHVWSIGSKPYAAYAMYATGADGLVTLAPTISRGRWAGWRGPEVKGPVHGLAEPVGGRFFLDERGSHGTAHLEYPQKGSLYLRGDDPRHEGGDLWVADVAIEVMKRDPAWRGLLVTMPSVDRVGHLLGEMNGPVELGQGPEVHLDRVLETADAAVGRIVDRLHADGLADRTLVIVTADHGGLAGRPYVGRPGPNSGYENWYYGTYANVSYRRPSPALAPLAGLPFVRSITADTIIRAWLTEPSPARLVEAGRVAFGLPGVEEVHVLMGDRYRRLFSRVGARPEVAALLETMATPRAAHVVAITDDRTTYGTRGDHGGPQPEAQRIPLVLCGPGLAAPGRYAGPARLVDLLPTVRRWLGLPDDPRGDGKALEIVK